MDEERTEGASTSSFIFPVPTGVGRGQYDVFLSFRGPDTRKTFTDHLYHSLVNAGAVPVCVFRDDNSIPIGEEFGSRILDAITQSKISIPIISENYASSKWCLRELICMMDCKKSTSHIVLPIFYKVAPTDVRHLKGNFGKSFHSSKKRFDEKDIEEGQRALREVSDLSGWESEIFANGHEGELVKEVIKTILSKLGNDFQLDVTKRLVGIDDHVNKIKNWVDTPARDARIIGIYGMGGIGKTTLAKVVYNKLSNDFKHRCFLSNIRERAHRDGIPYLQNQLIKEILPNEREVCTVDRGISLIRSRLKVNKVLIVLDDVDHKNQLDALAGERNWFMTGSIIIVTTRNKAILDQSEFEVDYSYELNEMDEVHSLLLFKRHAFHMDHSPTDFDDISREIISTMGGLPLALEVVGSYLFRKTNRNVWKDVLKQLKQQPHRDVQEILKISYDALEDGHKQIFLDIACFVMGKTIKFAMYMWEDCGFYPSQGIEELKLRCLIKIGDRGEFRMHDQLRDLGTSIFCRGQSPERCIKPWIDEEAFREQLDEMHRYTMEIATSFIHIDWKTWNYWPLRLQTCTSEQFKNLPSSRFLQLSQASLRGDFNGLFSELRWLQWFYAHPMVSFSAINLHLPELVVLELSHNRFTASWEGWNSIEAAKRLKVLDLSHSMYLRRTPDLSAFTELECLILYDCRELKQVHPSIGKVKSLVSLDLRCCVSLWDIPEEVGELEELKELILDDAGIRKIPSSIGSLRKLEKLSARNCQSLRKIPNSIGNLSSLEKIDLRDCRSLREIPGSIGNLSSLQHLDLCDCGSLREIPDSIGDLQNLQHLDISNSKIEKLPNTIGRLKELQRLILKYCDSLKGEIPSEIGDLSSLENLEITFAPISDLPESIRNLSSLKRLDIKGCFKLRSLPELPSGLTHLTVSCQSPRLPQLSCLIHLEELNFYRCDLLDEYIPELPSRLLKLHFESCRKLMVHKLEEFKYLEELSIEHCESIERLDISRLSCLKRLKAESCDNLVEIQGLERAEFLEALDISYCGSIEKLPDLSCLAALKKLNIDGCRNLRCVESLERFLSCRSINISGCESLEKLPNLSKFENLEKFTISSSLGLMEIPGVEESRSLTHMDIRGCGSLETLPDLSGCEKLKSLVVRDCKKLTQLHGLEKLALNYLDISGCYSLETIPELPRTRVVRSYEITRHEGYCAPYIVLQ